MGSSIVPMGLRVQNPKQFVGWCRPGVPDPFEEMSAEGLAHGTLDEWLEEVSISFR